MTKLTNAMKDLREELDMQKKHVEKVRSYLISKKDVFFGGVGMDSLQNITDGILQHCVLDR